jgi:hypothetical protein
MPTIQEILTPAVAAIGLGLSIYNTVQARRDRRPKLKVHVARGAFTGQADEQVIVEVGNGWSQPITLTSLCVPLPRKLELKFHRMNGDSQLPVVLTPGTSTRFWFDPSAFEAEVIKAGIGAHEKFRVLAGDALGNKYLSNRYSFKPTP